MWRSGVLVVVVLSSVSALQSSHGGVDPYETLGLSRGASSQEVRRAYKQAAKEWHPDKNPDPAAQNTFVGITKAYEVRLPNL
jgi:DnaJ family protein C protein 16